MRAGPGPLVFDYCHRSSSIAGAGWLCDPREAAMLFLPASRKPLPFGRGPRYINAVSCDGSVPELRFATRTRDDRDDWLPRPRSRPVGPLQAAHLALGRVLGAEQ